MTLKQIASLGRKLASFLALFADCFGRSEARELLWRRVIEATARHGGGVAHHHGAGRLRKSYLVHDLGENGVSLLRRLKLAVDPRGLMNPGNLIPDA